MAKFDFNSSRYARFFGDASNNRFLQTFISADGVLVNNYKWYTTQGRKAAFPTPTDSSGNATFTIKSRSIKAAPLMDLRAPLGESNQTDAEGLKFYSASIPDFSSTNSYIETAMERETRAKLFEIFGNDKDIVEAWVGKVQELVDSVDTTLNFMTAQLMSTGIIDYSKIGRGIRIPLHRADIADENKATAGAKLWTDADCRILDQMKAIEEKYREAWGYTGGMVWQLPKKMFYDVVLQNAQVKELVASYKNNPLAWQATTTGQSITEAAFKLAISDFDGISPIEIVEEKSRNITHNTDTFIHGWKENIAVLRPAGDAVEFEYKQILDETLFKKHGNESVKKTWAQTNNGLGLLVNTTRGNGDYKEWSTEILLASTPALVNFPHHVIVDTTTADE